MERRQLLGSLVALSALLAGQAVSAASLPAPVVDKARLDELDVEPAFLLGRSLHRMRRRAAARRGRRRRGR